MMNFNSWVIGLMFLCFSTLGFSQEMSVKGTVYDTTGARPIKNAMVMAVRMKDSLLLGFTRSSHDGTFTLDGFAVDTFA
ncbi:MAG: carboxypeptidase regulatory-like domain-containing protein, partial [Flavobacteriales bacterium]|nr:carboxypeptidase regulatory-like domain-containing protein [Flavobacteriales bacterium]